VSSSKGILSLQTRNDRELDWTPFPFREYLESHEGKIWQHDDTLRLLHRAKQIDDLIEQLMRAAGVELVE
jgi:hypothetical protein